VPDRKYRVAVVGGAGTWGQRYLRAYANHPDCQIIALVDPARDRRKGLADRYGIDWTCDSIEELLSADLPDIVSAIVPVASNPEIIIACARAGVKVVSCEKPIAVELSRADAMVDTCRECGTVFSCGSVYSGVPYLRETLAWIREGHLGQLTGAAIPGGLPREVAGGCCVQLTLLRLLTGMDAEWAEGWTLPPAPGWILPPGAAAAEIDCPAYGRLGLSGGIPCEIPEPRSGKGTSCHVAVSGEEGQVWLAAPRPVFIQGRGAESTPIFPAFLQNPPPADYFTLRIELLLRAFDTGREEFDSGHGYRQALEIAMVLKLSAQRDHQRISLPLEDRSSRIFPHPYRLHGGDVAGWESMGAKGPPRIG